MCVCMYVYVQTCKFILKLLHHNKQLLGINYVGKNWALVMMLQALPSLHKCFVVKITYYDYLSKKHYTHSHTHQINAKSRKIGHFFLGRNLLE